MYFSARLLLFLIFFVWMIDYTGGKLPEIAAGQLRPDSRGKVLKTKVV
jgi:hypothetical protein